MWIEDVSDGELARMPEPRLAAPVVQHEPTTILPKQLRREDLVVVVKSLTVSQGTSVRILSPGDKIDKRDPIVRRYPDYFA